MKIENFKPFSGQHCETTATGTLLLQIGIEVSEPMLFGLGEGLGFIYWKMKTMDFPFLGGRVKPDLLTQNIVRNLNLELAAKETASPQKAWDSVKELLDRKQAVGLKMDCFHLEYFSNPFHFAGHYAAIYGYDEQNAFLVDTKQQGSLVQTSLKSLALARSEKGPMASKNMYYTIKKTDQKFNLEKAILTAIRNNAAEYLNPPIANISYKGILKASTEIVKWFNTSKNIEGEFRQAALLMEKAGTGGALFRNLYRDFLKESYELLKLEQLKTGYEAFTEIAELWTKVSQLFEKVSETKDFQYVQEASDKLKTISVQERKAMEILITI
ncbi:BtrH N-terminal domain-containing protein [Chryseobacterium bernardetii]|uniref:BtrH N-terminal domain-containing protein n=1 Tax=Chryseobacterium bernardetii TaxID=1241978 RepID=UPI003017CCAD